MQLCTIQGWFFVIAKNQQKTLDPLTIDCEIKALLGEKKHILEDKFQFDTNTIITLRIHKTEHRFLLKKLHTGSCIFITGTLDPTDKNRSIMIEKINTQIHHGDLASFEIYNRPDKPPQIG